MFASWRVLARKVMNASVGIKHDDSDTDRSNGNSLHSFRQEDLCFVSLP